MANLTIRVEALQRNALQKVQRQDEQSVPMLMKEDRLFRRRRGTAPQAPARWVQVHAAYRIAGLALLQQLDMRESHKVAKLYPALFLCRHALELDLKATLAMAYVAGHAPDLDAKRDALFKTHDLEKLWKLLMQCSPIHRSNNR